MEGTVERFMYKIKKKNCAINWYLWGLWGSEICNLCSTEIPNKKIIITLSYSTQKPSDPRELEKQ